MKRSVLVLAIVFAIILCTCGALFFSYASPSLSDEIQSGDILFQTTRNEQSFAVMAATGSVITHVGIALKHANGKVSVIETGATVQEAPFDEWIGRGELGRLAIKRLEGVDRLQGRGIVKSAKKYAGRPYDQYFLMDDGSLYCSELVYKAYKENGLDIGHVEKFSDLHMDNGLVEKLVSQRIGSHPLCKSKSAEDCWPVILSENIVTPASLYDDQRLKTIYSNYLF